MGCVDTEGLDLHQLGATPPVRSAEMAPYPGLQPMMKRVSHRMSRNLGKSTFGC